MLPGFVDGIAARGDVEALHCIVRRWVVVQYPSRRPGGPPNGEREVVVANLGIAQLEMAKDTAAARDRLIAH
jgi:hypothetical protein